ncbi:MAG: hypothetical protein RI919_1103, partial [Actinomycetota bacterium]
NRKALLDHLVGHCLHCGLKFEGEDGAGVTCAQNPGRNL